MSKFQVGQVWVTRDGRKARIVAADRAHDSHPIVALVEEANGQEYMDTFRPSGYCLKDGQEYGTDLIREHREPREVWVNEYEGHGLACQIHESEKEADRVAAGSSKRIACIKFREVV